MFRLQGFDPLGGLLLPNPRHLFTGTSVLGVFPFRVLLTNGSRISFETLLLSCRLLTWHRSTKLARLQNFAPPLEPHSPLQLLHLNGSRSSLGVHIFEALFHRAPASPFGAAPLRHFKRHARRHGLCARGFLWRGSV